MSRVQSVMTSLWPARNFFACRKLTVIVRTAATNSRSALPPAKQTKQKTNAPVEQRCDRSLKFRVSGFELERGTRYSRTRNSRRIRVQTEAQARRPQMQNRTSQDRPRPLDSAPLGLARVALEAMTYRLRPEGLCLGSNFQSNPRQSPREKESKAP